MLNRATDEELIRYNKAIDYIKERERLNKIYGEYSKKGKLLQEEEQGVLRK